MDIGENPISLSNNKNNFPEVKMKDGTNKHTNINEDGINSNYRERNENGIIL